MENSICFLHIVFESFPKVINKKENDISVLNFVKQYRYLHFT